MKKHVGILIFFLSFTQVFAQQISDWENYTDMKNVTALDVNSNGIWAATNGGGFFYNTKTESFQTIHKTDGLFDNDLTSVTIDKYGKIWFGSANGSINVYNPATNSIHPILDIYNSDQTNKQINDIQASGDTIIVSTSFGISLIDPVNLIFYDTFFKFGSFPSNSQVNSALKSGLIYAATQNGIAVQKNNATNLSAPESWNNFTTSNGLPSNTINKVIIFNNNLIAATASGLSQFNGISWQSLIPSFNSSNINDILAAGDTLFILTNNSVYSYYVSNSNTILKSIYNSSSYIDKLAYSSEYGIIAAGSTGFVFIDGSSSNDFLHPNGPYVNQFPSMAVDNNGNLWSASGQDVTGQGFYEYSGMTWRNFNTANTPSLPTNYFQVVYAAPDNTIYFGSWGKGFIKVINSNIEDFSIANTGMHGIQVDPSFLVISAFGYDSKNDLWVLNYGAVDNYTLSALTPDSTWYHFQIPAAQGLHLEQNYNLVIDQYDTKWYSSLDASHPGLYYFNENKTFTNANDDISGYLTTSDGLNSNTISSVVVDQRGDVWVGTNAGVNIVTNTGGIFDGGKSSLVISSIFSLRQQIVTCMAVDPINDKWIGTTQGLILVSSDGTTVLGQFNTANSPLSSNNITSIAVDQNTGIVYVGTDASLTSFKTSAVKPLSSFSKLFIYPNPFVIHDGDVNNLTIDGLISNSEIKIVSITGKLIDDFQSPGGRIANWDGRDAKGNLVNSGVYLIVAFDQSGNNVTTSKVAVLRK